MKALKKAQDNVETGPIPPTPPTYGGDTGGRPNVNQDAVIGKTTNAQTVDVEEENAIKESMNKWMNSDKTVSETIEEQKTLNIDVEPDGDVTINEDNEADELFPYTPATPVGPGGFYKAGGQFKDNMLSALKGAKKR